MNILSVLKGNFSLREGVYIPSETMVTVWDTLATSDLLDAATSATSEAHAALKGREQIETLIRELPEGIVLDLGCGYGRIAEQLLPKRSFTAYIGVDGSTEMLRYAHARKVGRADITTPLHFVYGTINAIPLSDASVDSVVVSAVFLHNHKRVTAQSIKEIYRVLKPGGKLLVFGSFPNARSLMGLQGTLYHYALCLFGDQYRNGPVRFFTRSEVLRLLGSFKTIVIIPSGFAILPKRILIFPNIINRYYLEYLANPLNRMFARCLPRTWKEKGSTHHDVIASK